MRRLNDKGITLLEMIIVLTITALLTVMFIPIYMKTAENAHIITSQQNQTREYVEEIEEMEETEETSESVLKIPEP